MKAIAFLLLCAALPASGQQVQRIDYTLRIDTAALSFDVAMRIHNAPPRFTLAAAAHPEYDDKYWHFIDDLSVDGGRVVRQDSVLWNVSSAAREVVVRYRVRPPEQPLPRSAWKAFVARSGALGGGPHTFLYVVGSENASAVVHVQAPPGWQVATPLKRLGNAYHARDMFMLMDSPILAGQLREWRFAVRGVPHRVVYLPTPHTVAFDTTAFLNGLQRYVGATIDFFDKVPYDEYVFMYEDSAYSGGLEHVNSMTMGAMSNDLARNPNAVLPETAHEFFHTWNLMAMRPAEYRGVDYRVQPPVSSLWFSEGMTILYADLLRRRAGLPVTDSTRTAHLEYLIASYLGNPGNADHSAEEVSRVAYNAPPGALGDFSGSTHLQGEIIGNMLDLIVRDATNGLRSLDDVMRLMYRRFAGRPGFTGLDVQLAVNEVCRCDVASFFDSYVRGGHAMDFDRYVGLIGLKPVVSWADARGTDGQLQPDLRMRGFTTSEGSDLSLLLWNPESIWLKAGLHTGDRLVSINGRRIQTWPDMRNTMGALHIGDTARIAVERATGPYVTTVTVASWRRPSVHMEEIANASEKQRRLREHWLRGAATR